MNIDITHDEAQRLINELAALAGRIATDSQQREPLVRESDAERVTFLDDMIERISASFRGATQGAK